MAFEVLIQQIKAIGTVAGQLQGHVASAVSKASLGALVSPVLGAHMMLGDALRLLALIEDLPAFDNYDFDIALGHVDASNTISWMALFGDKERIYHETAMLREAVSGLEEAYDALQFQIATLVGLVQDLAHLQGAMSTDLTALEGTRSALMDTVLPELYQFRDQLKVILDTYRHELTAREDFLWHLNKVYKFVLPRLQKKKPEPTLEGEEESSDEEALDEAFDEEAQRGSSE